MSLSSLICRIRFAVSLVLSCTAVVVFVVSASAETEDGLTSLTYTTSPAPARFVSVHGRRAAMFGYSQDGLEFWAYPFQIVSSYHVSFRPQGTTTAIDGASLLRRIIYNPEAVTRIYAGPDFVVREHIFVPLNEAGAVIRYEVESAHPIEIDVHFKPVLNLMWPGGIGGQAVRWSESGSAYVLSEETHRFMASIGSPNIVGHDETGNLNRQTALQSHLGFTVRADAGHPAIQVIIATQHGNQDLTEVAKNLAANSAELERQAVAHYSDLMSHVLRIKTPDEAVNRSLAWAEIALDQAWVCNPDLGCGLVAGYGPSRRARRPQYDWFFAGDGMVDLPALLGSGQYDRAREELEFILKYQDQRTGMIWHELSQSAGWLEWRKYPYMFVHVELTFDFLNSVADYFSTTGDRQFVLKHWDGIQAAYEYCRSLLDPKDGLPRIPAGKEAAREQEQLTEELALSANWVATARSFADLAAATGHDSASSEAAAISRHSGAAISRRYWDEKQNFWITGYTRSGTPLSDRQIGPVHLLGEGLFSGTQRDSVLRQLATSDYETDWGTRGRASSSSTYDPNSYANGSVWGISTAAVASAFWSAHWPATAFPIWAALVPWSSLDSLGHMHETLAGDYFHEEFESVPEQTWSSATFFAAGVNGLLGLKVNGASNSLIFAPHLPANWRSISLRHLTVSGAQLDLTLTGSTTETRLAMHNPGSPLKVTFDPAIPFGAKLRGAWFQDHSVSAVLEPHQQDTHARIDFELPHGDSVLTVDYNGGVEITPDTGPVSLGDPSHGVKITNVSRRGRLYTVSYEAVPSVGGAFDVITGWSIENVEGAHVENTSPGCYRVVIASRSDVPKKGYEHGEVQIAFGNRK